MPERDRIASGLRRRDFLKGAAATGGLVAAAGCRSGPAYGVTDAPDRDLVALAEIALGIAEEAGASYADCRIADYRRQRLSTRELRVQSVSDSEDRGFGVRVLFEGTWGFAASPRITADEIARVTRRALALARTNAAVQREPVVLSPNPAHVAVWNTPIRRDPFEVPLDEKIAKLLEINELALAQDAVSFVSSSMDFVREHKLFASTDGARIEQTLQRCNPTFRVTSVDRERGTFTTRNSYASPQGLGYEYVEDYPWLEDAQRASEDVREKALAPSVEPGKRDLILHPSNLWLTIHESIGHPTEYDRAIGMEANYAGTSFLTPDKLGHYRLASDLVSFQAEKTAPGALATSGYDDDGVRTMEWPLVEDGIFVDYQLTRDQAPLLGRPASYGCSYAQSWSQVPFQRMPNINLVPGDNDWTLDELVADTEDAILIYARGSYSIDHQRYNFQFGGQTFWDVKNGKVVGQLKDVAYQARTPDFWNACDFVCGPRGYELNGSFYDGKGEPGQVNAVSHGCSPARFRGIRILNTGSQA